MIRENLSQFLPQTLLKLIWGNLSLDSQPGFLTEFCSGYLVYMVLIIKCDLSSSHRFNSELNLNHLPHHKHYKSKKDDMRIRKVKFISYTYQIRSEWFWKILTNSISRPALTPCFPICSEVIRSVRGFFAVGHFAVKKNVSFG